MPPTLNCGIDANVSIPLKFLHPSEYIREKLSNYTSNQELDDCRVIRCEQKYIHRSQHLTVVVSHESFKGKELYCMERYAKVTKEGPPEKFFDKNITICSDVQPTIGIASNVEEQQEIPSVCFQNFCSDNPDLRAAVEAGLLQVDKIYL